MLQNVTLKCDLDFKVKVPVQSSFRTEGMYEPCITHQTTVKHFIFVCPLFLQALRLIYKYEFMGLLILHNHINIA